MARLGSRVECDLKPGLTGTVVHVNSSSGSWPRVAPSYDVLWDDMTCTRAVAQTLIDGQGWRLLEIPCLSAAECNTRWYDFQVARAREMQLSNVGRPTATAAAAPSAANPSAKPTLVGDMATAMADHAVSATQPTGRVAAKAARELLAESMPRTRFAVSCERRILTIAWMDGPLPGSIYRRAVKLVNGTSVVRVRLQRGLTETLVRAAVDYCLWRTFGRDGAAAARAAQKVTPAAYLAGGLDSVRSPNGLCFQTLMRCVLDRWDDHQRQFIPTKSTAGLVQELQAMFPYGDAAASADFEPFRDVVTAYPDQEVTSNLRETARQ